MSGISFFASNSTVCPVCDNDFKQEVLRTGGGRIIAGDLQEDLRRSYNPSPKYGLINPLIYSIVVCPNCLYATMPDDFKKPKPETITKVTNSQQNRKEYMLSIFGSEIDFKESRNSIAGVVSMFLALSTYSHFTKDFAPTAKKAICSIRASWLCKDLIEEFPDRQFDTLYWYFRHLAWKLYEQSIRYAESGQERFDNVKKWGPDVDTDYGYDGGLYLMSYLGFELKDFLDEKIQYKKFSYYQKSLAKVFGFGRSSKEKPSNILYIVKDLHSRMGDLVLGLKDKYGELNSLE